MPLRVEGEGLELGFFVADINIAPRSPYYLGTATHVPPGMDAIRASALAKAWLLRCPNEHTFYNSTPSLHGAASRNDTARSAAPWVLWI